MILTNKCADNLRFAMSTCLWGYPDDTLVQSTVCRLSSISLLAVTDLFAAMHHISSLWPIRDEHTIRPSFAQPLYIRILH